MRNKYLSVYPLVSLAPTVESKEHGTTLIDGFGASIILSRGLPGLLVPFSVALVFSLLVLRQEKEMKLQRMLVFLMVFCLTAVHLAVSRPL